MRIFYKLVFPDLKLLEIYTFLNIHNKIGNCFDKFKMSLFFVVNFFKKALMSLCAINMIINAGFN